MAAVSKETAWNFAIGMMQVDGAAPSEEFLELVEREKKGEITTEDIRRITLEQIKEKQNQR